MARVGTCDLRTNALMCANEYFLNVTDCDDVLVCELSISSISCCKN